MSITQARTIRDSFEWLGALLASTVMCMLVVITFVDVIGRKIGYPLSFAFEFTQVTVGIMFYLTLPLVTLRREHIVVDLIPLRHNGLADILSEIFVNLFSAGIVAIAAIQLWQQGITLANYHTVMMFTRWPIAPLVYIMSVLAAISAFILLALSLDSIIRAVAIRRDDN